MKMNLKEKLRIGERQYANEIISDELKGRETRYMKRDERAEEMNERTNEWIGRNELPKLDERMEWIPVILHRRTYLRIREENNERITLNFFISGSLGPVVFFFF